MEQLLVLLGDGDALEVVVVELVTIGFEGEIVTPVIHELGVVDLPAHGVPLLVVGNGEPAEFGCFEAAGGLVNELKAGAFIGLMFIKTASVPALSAMPLSTSKGCSVMKSKWSLAPALMACSR